MRMVAIGGSDAGISAALRAREVDPGAEVTVVVADAYPNFSICGVRSLPRPQQLPRLHRGPPG
jgi:NADPH-dependent 2,4-dienoyl-CoA reductase/sulfur reductase-like enzyme